MNKLNQNKNDFRYRIIKLRESGIYYYWTNLAQLKQKSLFSSIPTETFQAREFSIKILMFLFVVSSIGIMLSLGIFTLDTLVKIDEFSTKTYLFRRNNRVRRVRIDDLVVTFYY